jgi:hypothetical protein
LRTHSILAGAFAVTALFSSASAVEAIRFPSDYKSHTLYATVDIEKADMIRDVYADRAIVKAVAAHQPLPPAGVITMPMYRAKHDDKGAFVKDDKGRLVRDEMFGIFVMQRQADNVGWSFAAFTPGGQPGEPKDTSFCIQCHGGPDAKDGLFTLPQLLKLSP